MVIFCMLYCNIFMLKEIWSTHVRPVDGVYRNKIVWGDQKAILEAATMFQASISREYLTHIVTLIPVRIYVCSTTIYVQLYYSLYLIMS